MEDSYMTSLRRIFPHLQPSTETLRNQSILVSSVSSMTESDPYLTKRIQWRPLSTGKQGTRETLQVMAQLARKAAANEAFSQQAAQLGSLSAVDTFIRSNYRYRDEMEEIIRTPEFMLNDLQRIGYIEGDCDDVSTLYAAFARALQYPARFVAIRYTPSNPNFEHVFTQAYAGGEWKTFDGTVQPGTVLEALEEMTEEV